MRPISSIPHMALCSPFILAHKEISRVYGAISVLECFISVFIGPDRGRCHLFEEIGLVPDPFLSASVVESVYGAEGDKDLISRFFLSGGR